METSEGIYFDGHKVGEDTCSRSIFKSVSELEITAASLPQLIATGYRPTHTNG